VKQFEDMLHCGKCSQNSSIESKLVKL